jgi:hypothetical protein
MRLPPVTTAVFLILVKRGRLAGISDVSTLSGVTNKKKDIEIYRIDSNREKTWMTQIINFPKVLADSLAPLLVYRIKLHDTSAVDTSFEGAQSEV